MKVSSDPSPKRKPWVSVLVAAFLLGVVAFVVVPNVFLGRTIGTQCDKARCDIAELVAAVATYSVDHDGIPPGSLEELVVPDERGRTYLRGRTVVPLDAWKRPYHYALADNDAGFRVWSFARDGQPGGKGQDADIDSATLASRED